jgi:hypothetical protein
MTTLEEIAQKKVSCKKITEFKNLYRFLYKLKYSWENEVRLGRKVHGRICKQKYFIIIRNIDGMFMEDIPLHFNSRSVKNVLKLPSKHNSL